MNQQIYYHITPTTNMPSIKTHGLLPNKPSKYEQKGVYCFTNLDAIEDALCNWLNDKFDDDTPLTLITIKLPIDHNIRIVHLNAVAYETILLDTISPEFIIKEECIE